MSNDTVTKVFGGSPLAVLGRLVLVSILVGVVLAALGLDPFDIMQQRGAADPLDLEHGLRRVPLAVALFPARRGDRDPDLDHHAHGQCAAREIVQLGQLSAVISAASDADHRRQRVAVAALERRQQVGLDLRHHADAADTPARCKAAAASRRP